MIGCDDHHLHMYTGIAFLILKTTSAYQFHTQDMEDGIRAPDGQTPAVAPLNSISTARTKPMAFLRLSDRWRLPESGVSLQ